MNYVFFFWESHLDWGTSRTLGIICVFFFGGACLAIPSKLQYWRYEKNQFTGYRRFASRMEQVTCAVSAISGYKTIIARVINL